MWLWGTGMLYVIGSLVVFLIGGAVYYQVKLSRRKGGWTREAFVAEFGQTGVPASLSGAVYDYYRKHSILKSFRVAPGDSLEGVYSASHDEVDEAVLELSERLGIALPPESVLHQWPTPLVTVRDMVFWLDWARRGAPPQSSR
jgi:hypothetical protein